MLGHPAHDRGAAHPVSEHARDASAGRAGVQAAVETMGEAMRSFHSMIELQSMSMQTIQKQMELARGRPAAAPPDYVGLGKTLLEILRDPGNESDGFGYVRRPLPARRNQEHRRSATLSQPTSSEGAPTQSDQHYPAAEDDSQEAPAGAEGRHLARADELRRFSRMGQCSPWPELSPARRTFRDLLTDIRKDRREPGANCRGKSPASPSVKTPAVACEKTSGTATTQAPVLSSNTPPVARPRCRCQHRPQAHRQTAAVEQTPLQVKAPPQGAAAQLW